MNHRPTILFSDDEPLLVAALQRQARRMGLDSIPDTTSDVQALAKRHRPAVIVLDLHQRIDGRDLLAELKRDPETRDLKVIVLSAFEDQFVRRTCLELGALGYELKPFDPSFIRKLARIAATVAWNTQLH